MIDSYSIYGGNEVKEIMHTLLSLSPLPKPHYSWSYSDRGLVFSNQELAEELAQVMGSLTVGINSGVNQKLIETFGRILLSTSGSLVIHTSPWKRVVELREDMGWGKWRGMRAGDPRKWTKMHDEEIQRIARAVEDISGLVRCPVVFILDYEHWRVTGESDIDNAIIENLKRFDGAIRQNWSGGDLLIIWQSRGGFRSDPEFGWVMDEAYPPGSPGENCSITWYASSDIRGLRKSVVLTASARANADLPIYTTISLGTQSRVIRGKRDLYKRPFRYGQPFDPVYSWRMGMELNHHSFSKGVPGVDGGIIEKVPYERIAGVILEPGAFNKNVPNWLEHFVEYCQGASLIGREV